MIQKRYRPGPYKIIQVSGSLNSLMYRKGEIDVIIYKANAEQSIETLATAVLFATAPDCLEQHIKNLEFLEWVAGQNFNIWSDKRELLHDCISATRAAIRGATTLPNL